MGKVHNVYSKKRNTDVALDVKSIALQWCTPYVSLTPVTLKALLSLEGSNS